MQIIRKDKIYVKVRIDIDRTGFMQPREIIWQDGRRFPIDSVSDYHPLKDGNQSCYTVTIGGNVRHLFVEKVIPQNTSRVFRWFVEREVNEDVRS